MAVWVFLMQRYGRVMQGVIFQPGSDAIMHLAGLLRKLEQTFPPFRMLQRLIGRILPMANPDAKPGGSVSGDLVQYLYGWHAANPGDEVRPALWEAMYHYDPKIPELPFYPKSPEAAGPVQEERKIMTPEEYEAMMRGETYDGRA